MTNPKDEQTSLHDLLAMEEVLLTGVRALDSASQLIFVRRCVNPEHWAGSTKRKAALMSGEVENGTTSSNQGAAKSAKASSAKSTTAAAASPDPSVSATTSFATSSASTIPTSSTSTTASTSAGSNTVAPSNFSVAIPGVNGALDSTFLRGKTFVITGTFPEANGSGDDDAGIANVTAMIRSFGGKVITRFSKLASKFNDCIYDSLSAMIVYRKARANILYTNSTVLHRLSFGG